jgi:hypothetical protein
VEIAYGAACAAWGPERAGFFASFRLPFEEGRVDSAIKLTYPHVTPPVPRLSARPDLRHCEVLQARNPRELAMLELTLIMHLSTDGKDTTIMRQRSGAQKRTIIKRLKMKEGRMRGNLMGKRVFSSGRAVISPCQSLDVDELGVPRSMACVLTFGRVMVTPATLPALRRCVRIGALRVGGANLVVKAADGTRIYLEYAVDREPHRARAAAGGHGGALHPGRRPRHLQPAAQPAPHVDDGPPGAHHGLVHAALQLGRGQALQRGL